MWDAISYAHSPLVVVCPDINSIHPVLLPVLDQAGDALFQQDNARVHTAWATHHALQTDCQFSWPTHSPDLPVIEHVWDCI